jgi:Holliday junction DNA helicase RuvA
MIATLEGTVSENNLEQVILDVHGVGYGIYVTSEDQGALQSGKTVKFYIYEHIREASHDLFGFVQPATKQLFEQLLSVNGVGPKMALSILNLGSAGNVSGAIANQDTSYIQQASGVGKRVAERVVLDLKDKVGVAGVFTGTPAAQKDDAVQGLVALGYTLQDAQNALSEIDPKLSTEERIKQALKGQA